MESLSNFNFLKIIDVKNNNDKNTDDKNLESTEKFFSIGQFENIENTSDNIQNDQQLEDNLLSLDKKKSEKAKQEFNLDSSGYLLAETNIKNSENGTANNLNSTFFQSKKEKNSSLNIKIPYDKSKILTKSLEKVSNQKVVANDSENIELYKLQPGFEKAEEIKLKSHTQNILNPVKKSKIKSFFQNYFNFTLKKYNKKNINLKKFNLVNFINYDKNNLREVPTTELNKSININENNKITEHKIYVNFDNNSREFNNINESNIKANTEKNASHTNENTFDSFDRLKNILDIRSNDIKQRFSQILENNIRMNNNKFEIQLRPENLGKIHITLEITGQNVDININSENINAIQSLTENNSNLQKMLQNHGMNLNNFNFNGNNNKGHSKDFKKSDGIKNENVSVNTKENNDDDNDNFMSNKIVYAKA